MNTRRKAIMEDRGIHFEDALLTDETTSLDDVNAFSRAQVGQKIP